MAGTLLIVEGAHDAAFFGSLLKKKCFENITTISRIKERDPSGAWSSLIPTKYPFKEDLLDRISPVPDYYFHSNGRICCVVKSDGIEKIKEKLISSVRSIGLDAISGIGLVVDADKDSAGKRFIQYCDELASINTEMKEDENFPLPLPQHIGQVFAGPPKIGIHVFPNNAAPGALETVLLECARTNAPDLHDCADNAVKKIIKANPKGRDFKKLRKPMGSEKATAGIIANLLYPGASLASSLKSDVWLRGDALNHPAVQQADAFLQALL
jgi:hypothetical protein